MPIDGGGLVLALELIEIALQFRGGNLVEPPVLQQRQQVDAQLGFIRAGTAFVGIGVKQVMLLNKT